VAADLNGETPSDQQLAELRQRLAEKQEIGSELLVEQLNQRKESPWSQITNGRPLTQYKLSILLRDFEIKPLWIGSENARKRGYLRSQFNGPWEAYLRAQDTAFSQRTPQQGLQDVQKAQDEPIEPALRSCQGVQPRIYTRTPANPDESARSANSAALAQPAQTANPVQGSSERKHAQAPETPVVAPETTRSPADGFNRSATDFSLRKPPRNDFLAPQKPGNGADPERPASVATLIRLMHATHPEWSEERLAKASGQPVSIVKRTLARKPRHDHSPTGIH
jgi:hypothetical protein